MSFKLKWNDSWLFTKKGELVEENRRVLDAEGCEQVTLPHTWNGKDGQDGGFPPPVPPSL